MTRSTASLALTIRATDSTGPLPVDVAAIAETIAVAVRDSYSPGGINLLGYADVGALVVQLSINGVEYDDAGIPIAAPAPEADLGGATVPSGIAPDPPSSYLLVAEAPTLRP